MVALIFGINLIFIGLRLLHWGYYELENLRERDRRMKQFDKPGNQINEKTIS